MADLLGWSKWECITGSIRRGNLLVLAQAPVSHHSHEPTYLPNV